MKYTKLNDDEMEHIKNVSDYDSVDINDPPEEKTECHKCHWEGNEFKGCCEKIDYIDGNHWIDRNGSTRKTIDYNFCPFCGARLEKPIKKKDGTLK